MIIYFYFQKIFNINLKYKILSTYNNSPDNVSRIVEVMQKCIYYLLYSTVLK